MKGPVIVGRLVGRRRGLDPFAIAQLERGPLADRRLGAAQSLEGQSDDPVVSLPVPKLERFYSGA
jgi:hypothetical protein